MIFYYQQFVINFKVFNARHKQPLCMADNKILTRSLLNDLTPYSQNVLSESIAFYCNPTSRNNKL